MASNDEFELDPWREQEERDFLKFAAKHNCTSLEEAGELMYRKMLEEQARQMEKSRNAPLPTWWEPKPANKDIDAKCKERFSKKLLLKDAGRQASPALQPGQSQCTAVAEGVQLVTAELSAVHLQSGPRGGCRAASLPCSACSKL